MAKNTLIILAVILVVLFIGYQWFRGMYNSLVTLDEGVTSAWAQVQNQYQRRLDLIPNLVEVVKGYAAHEREVFEKVAEARSNVGKLQITPEVLKDPQLFQKFQQAQAGLTSALSRLLAVAENYPQLKANENFLQLQSQLEGTENRITNERRRFNEAAQVYNTMVNQFPGRIFANLFGFKEKSYFQAAPGSDKAPVVDFSK